MNQLAATISVQVRLRREALGFTQFDLSQATGFACKPSCVSMLEMGKRQWRPKYIEMFSRALQCEAHELLQEIFNAPKRAEGANNQMELV